MAKKKKEDGTEHEETAAENEGMPPKPRFQITAPVSNFKGERAGVKFTEGKGSTEDPCLANWFKDIGFAVAEEE